MKFMSLKKSPGHSNSESHVNNDNCSFLCVLEGCTPVNKLSIRKYANIVFCNCNSTPHVTLFWKVFWQELLRQTWNLNLSLVWCVDQGYFLRYRPVNNAIAFSVFACSPLRHIRPGPEFMRLHSTQIQIQNFCYYLNNDQAILSQFYHK